MTNETAIVPQSVAFYGDEILAVLDPGSRRVYVPFGKLCENIGLDRPSQAARVQDHAVLKDGFLTLTLQTAGGPQETQCLRLDLLPFWLATINVSRVKAALRERLLLYQRDCAAVLWDVFRPAGQPSSVALDTVGADISPAAQAYEMAIAIASLARQQMSLESQFAEIASKVTDQAARLTALEVTLTPRTAINEAQAAELAQAVKFVARELGALTKRNEYGAIYGQLYRAFDIVSYKNLPVEQFEDAMTWLREWYRQIQGGSAEPPARV